MYDTSEAIRPPILYQYSRRTHKGKQDAAAAAGPSSDLGAGDESYGNDGTVAESDAATACGHVQSLGDRPAGEGRGAEEAS
ncbi:hypothetical protein DY000_02037628 [Brassica cretica]|uniref:Uncharacterized protein n=1 Tax=Brassica cretica TaxID=69181 RepID=A0ABQ7B5J5_BRACR|nr:hypothetical protein DY000_02037628 [Brassica cretica]